MRSLDRHLDISGENPSDFEKTLLKAIGKLKEKKEDLSHQDLKKFVRFYCMKNASSLGVNEEEATQIAQYFFRFLYEDPQKVTKMWDLLYELSQNATNQQAAEQAVSQLLELNTVGVTHLWRVIRGIVRGDFEIKPLETKSQKAYFLNTPEDATEMQTDKQRQQVSSSLKEKVKDKIVDKPTPSVSEDAVKMTKQDRDLFLKIYQYMQSDADALLSSTSWQPVIAKYFEGITKHLLSTVKLLEVGKRKSNARKKRYRAFILHALKGYLKPLSEYCKQMTENNNENNPFASDLLFEHYLLSNGMLVDNVREPAHEVIEGKWQKLFKDMRIYIEDDATLFGIPILAPPDHFGTQVTDEIPPKELQETNRTLIMKSLKPTPTTPDAYADTIEISTLGKNPEKDNWADVWETKPKTANDTGEIQTLISEEIDKYSKTEQIPKGKTRKRKSRSLERLNYPYICVAPGTEAEIELTKKIRRFIDNVFNDHKEDIKSEKNCNQFIHKLTLIAKKHITTLTLMTEFASHLLAHYHDMNSKLTQNEAQNVFDNIIEVFNAIKEKIIIPEKIVKLLGEKARIKTPKSDTINEIADGIPSIDESRFAHLKEYLEKKGLYKQFTEIESLAKETLDTDVRQLQCLSEANKKISRAFSPEDGFSGYYEQKEKLFADAYMPIKKLTGNWFTKHFKLGRSKEVKQEMEEYTRRLEESIKATWNQALEQIIRQYGIIIFGSDLYVQR